MPSRRRVPLAHVLWWVALWLLALPVPTRAEDVPPGVADAHVLEALEAAGDNRKELDAYLAWSDGPGDPQVREAARFLVANMQGKGYVVTRLVDGEGNTIPFDPLAYPDFRAARDAIEAIEAAHDTIEFARDRLVEDMSTITSAFLVRHTEEAFAAWRETPDAHRVDFDTFLNHVLPYRGSQEPIDAWLPVLRARYAGLWTADGEAADRETLYRRISEDVHGRVRFNERYYLHPTDQGFSEMEASGQGRCEDITNMITYAARSLALATAADYTPAWAHRDNNHAWNVLLDREGRGSDPAQAHAAKIYRKTFAIQRDALAFQLPDGSEAPNRFLQSRTYVDVTSTYAPTTDVEVAVDMPADGAPAFAYLCVFNGGRWTAIHWARVEDGRVTFTDMGRGILYLPAAYDGEALQPVGPPLLVHRNGAVETLAATGGCTDLLATALRPRQKSPDTHEVTPVSHLKAGSRYLLHAWFGGAWQEIDAVAAGEEPLRFLDLPSDGLYWLVEVDSRRLERPFTIREGRQRFW